METVQQDPKRAGKTEWTFAKEIVLLDAIIAQQKEVEMETQVIQIGPAAIVPAPGEMFCQFGLDLKRNSPFRLTFPVGLANGSAGYIPTEEAFSPSGGGYETRLTSYSNLEITTGPRIVAEDAKISKALTPAPIPEPPVAEPFSDDSPSPYGNAGPELN